MARLVSFTFAIFLATASANSCIHAYTGLCAECGGNPYFDTDLIAGFKLGAAFTRQDIQFVAGQADLTAFNAVPVGISACYVGVREVDVAEFLFAFFICLLGIITSCNEGNIFGVNAITHADIGQSRLTLATVRYAAARFHAQQIRAVFRVAF